VRAPGIADVPACPFPSARRPHRALLARVHTPRIPHRQVLLDAMDGRLLEQNYGDAGDTVAVLLIVALSLTGICAFLGWYSRRRG
jgi:hypothetical protein